MSRYYFSQGVISAKESASNFVVTIKRALNLASDFFARSKVAYINIGCIHIVAATILQDNSVLII